MYLYILSQYLHYPFFLSVFFTISEPFRYFFCVFFFLRLKDFGESAQFSVSICIFRQIMYSKIQKNAEKGGILMNYKGISPSIDFEVEELFSVHYFEYMSDFVFAGESHDFWEFLCVDRGEVEVTADNHHYTLKRGEIIFHKPNEFHGLKANGTVAPNLVVVSFQCNSPAMRFFEEKILTIDEIERNLLASIIIEARNAFSSKLDDPYLEELIRTPVYHLGSEQLIFLYIQQFLIHVYRRYSISEYQTPSVPSTKPISDTENYKRILTYLENNLSTHLTIDQICRANLIGRSQLQKLFREKNNCGVIDYFCRMKISAARQMIRNQDLNFTQIADRLGYTSIHYFSRQFKKITGMSPSEYASSIKLLSEEPNHQTHADPFT